jgi:hypothetical protein
MKSIRNPPDTKNLKELEILHTKLEEVMKASGLTLQECFAVLGVMAANACLTFNERALAPLGSFFASFGATMKHNSPPDISFDAATFMGNAMGQMIYNEKERSGFCLGAFSLSLAKSMAKEAQDAGECSSEE